MIFLCIGNSFCFRFCSRFVANAELPLLAVDVVGAAGVVGVVGVDGGFSCVF